MEEIHQDRTGALASPVSARIYEGRVARIHPDGDPLRYAWGDEFRDEAGIQEIVAELQFGKPFTLNHPTDLVSRGATADVVGQVISARIDGAFVVARILITDPRGIAAIDSGINELSLGYTSRLDETRRQRDIKIDHLALVPRARCGASCALRTDCTCINCAISYNSSTVADSPNIDIAPAGQMFAADEIHVQSAMDTFNPGTFKGPSDRKAAFHNILGRAHQLGIDPLGFEKKYRGLLEVGDPQGIIVMDELQKKLGEALASAATEKARADQLDVELKAVKTSLTSAEIASTNAQAALVTEKTLTEAANVRADQAKTDADAVVTKAKLDAGTAVSAAVASRVQLLTEANQVLGVKDAKGQPIDRSAMDDQAIRLAVIKHVDNLDFPADKDPVFVQGVYTGSLARAATASASRAAVRGATAQVRGDAARVVTPPAGNAARVAELAAQKAMTDDQAKRWRTKAN